MGEQVPQRLALATRMCSPPQGRADRARHLGEASLAERSKGERHVEIKEGRHD